jgi:hypothetical protein
MKILLLLLPLVVWSTENKEDAITAIITSADKSESESIWDSNKTQSFITDYEYGEMLYNAPRGVSCAKCHGGSGEGKVIVHYKDTDKKEDIIGVDIRKYTLNEMIDSVGSYHKVMPRYYLTKKEVKIIYEFLEEKNK